MTGSTFPDLDLLAPAIPRHSPAVGREGNPVDPCRDGERPLDAALLQVEQTESAPIAAVDRRGPAVGGQGHVLQLRWEGRDDFTAAQAPRVPKLDRAVLLGRRDEQPAPPGEHGGTSISAAPAEGLDGPGVAPT